MAFVQKTYIFEESIEIEKGYTHRYHQKGEKRVKKSNPTPDQVKEYNRRQAEKRLRRLIKANFKKGDWHLTLTYDKNDRPTPEEANETLKKFIRKLRAYCKKHYSELKYIHVTEYMNAAIHHHVIIADVPGLQQYIIKNWPYNTNWTPMYEGERVEVLASYLIKETDKTFRLDPAAKQRYACSRNLVRPEPIITICSKNIDKRPIVPKKYRAEYIMDVDYYVFGVSEVTGYAYQSMILRKVKANGKE